MKPEAWIWVIIVGVAVFLSVVSSGGSGSSWDGPDFHTQSAY